MTPSSRLLRHAERSSENAINVPAQDSNTEKRLAELQTAKMSNHEEFSNVASSFANIGKGVCGSIWAVNGDGHAYAMKREDGADTRSVQIDAIMHQHIEASLLVHRVNYLKIPRFQTFVPKSDLVWWAAKRTQFPDGSEHCNTLVSERIPPFQRRVRDRLIDLYCPSQLREGVRGSRRDEDCLVRPYLGRRTQRPSRFFTLRNKALHVDQMEDLNLPMTEYSDAMADALAIMLWHSKVDANDVEFVLAPKGAHARTKTWQSVNLGEHTMWLLDFDCVKVINLDAKGIEQAASAFLRNDPYYPRPSRDNAQDQLLWSAFAKRFIQSSREILGTSDLPQAFIHRVEQLTLERRKQVRGSATE